MWAAIARARRKLRPSRAKDARPCSSVLPGGIRLKHTPLDTVRRSRGGEALVVLDGHLQTVCRPRGIDDW